CRCSFAFSPRKGNGKLWPKDRVLTLINIAFRTINHQTPSQSIPLLQILSLMQNSVTMKRVIIVIGVLVCLAAAQVVVGQVAEGVIHYETKINMHRSIPAEREGMKTMIPEFRTVKNQLFFNGIETLYKPVIEDEEEDRKSVV